MTALAVVKFLHILAAASWLGAALWTPGDVRRTLALGKPYTDALSRRARPALALDLWTGVATLLTGIALIALEGGVPRIGVTVGFAAVLLRLGLLLGAMRPALHRIEGAIQAGDLPAAEPAAKRLAMFSGIGHLLWVVALAGMVFPW